MFIKISNLQKRQHVLHKFWCKRVYSNKKKSVIPSYHSTSKVFLDP